MRRRNQLRVGPNPVPGFFIFWPRPSCNGQLLRPDERTERTLRRCCRGSIAGAVAQKWMGGIMSTTSLSLSGKLRRDAGIVGLLFASTTSMVGSGWLFGSYHAAKIAGPLSIGSWVLGAIIIMLIALCFAELAALFPRSGALVHMSHASHGEGLGRIWCWLLFLAYVPVPAVEAEAIVTYANNYLPYFIRPGNEGLLTTTGFIACAALLGVTSLLNLMVVRWLLNVNSTITWWKILV